MNRSAFTRWTRLAAGLLLGPLLAGCIPFLPVYYSYPTLGHVPAVPVEVSPEARG